MICPYLYMHAIIPRRMQWERDRETYSEAAFENHCHLHCVNTGLS